MGVRNSSGAFLSYLGENRPDFVISTGFAGALQEGLAIGEPVFAAGIHLHPEDKSIPCNVKEISRYAMELRMKEGSFITLSEWKRKSELSAFLLKEGFQNPVCETETYPLAGICLERKIPFFAFRTITDLAGEEIGFTPDKINGPDGEFSTFKTMTSILKDPALIREAARLARASDKAARSISEAAISLLKIL